MTKKETDVQKEGEYLRDFSVPEDDYPPQNRKPAESFSTFENCPCLNSESLASSSHRRKIV